METKVSIKGGICSPRGFKATGAACGIKKDGAKDMALIVSDRICSAAAVYTTNKVKGAPLTVTKRNLADGKARAIICNSGNANTCAPDGIKIAEETCRITAETIGCRTEDVVVCSTGVIGQQLAIEPFAEGIPRLTKNLSGDGSQDAAEAIMTTDIIPKSIAVEFQLDGKSCRIGGIAKGSGMIDPNMATMLSFITTDVAIVPELLQQALSEDVKTSYNQICVDGDTSTNDMVVVLANGMAGNRQIDEPCEALEKFKEALSMVTTHLAKMLARDGEGATKLIECIVEGAPDDRLARKISKSVISSNLLKAAMFGEDANWGRVLCAIGYTEGDFSGENIDVAMGSAKGRITVCKGSRHEAYSEERASEILSEEEILITVDLHQGDGKAAAWGCDLTYDYVRINGDYRS
ncbi:MAG: bifunctional glutamate N-acetyltransferase/amino-acid acetyltransferase ArgJ [Bacillota bacterium]|nr:bifunctional glutamate N-acetyltransferase/amino-acid acetyltransferase ArgJ [Bacillota bacterium]